jgi:hypothetical protein
VKVKVAVGELVKVAVGVKVFVAVAVGGIGVGVGVEVANKSTGRLHPPRKKEIATKYRNLFIVHLLRCKGDWLGVLYERGEMSERKALSGPLSISQG